MQVAERRDDHDQREVGAEHAPLQPTRRLQRDDPRAEQDDPQRPEPEHDERVAEEPVAKALVPGRAAVLVDRERLDVADPAAVEVARGRVMDRVLAPPHRERRADEDAEGRAEERVVALRLEERAVRAVVEDDEHAQQEAGRDDRERTREPGRDPSEATEAPISPRYTATEVKRLEIARPRRGTA